MEGLYVGIMSGTSLDGIDIALLSIHPAKRARLLGAVCLPFPDSLRSDLLHLCQPGPDEIFRAGVAGQAWARLAANGVNALLGKCGVKAAEIKAIGSHGQTVRHHPENGFSLQIGAPALLAELCNITVISDFRSRDLAAQGEGAPLVPAFHTWLLSTPDQNRTLINIGGFANLTLLRPSQTVTGFDSGPGNVLLDAWIQRHKGAAFDADGNWARTGKVAPGLLDQMLSDPYFARTAPKSTGREYFNENWLDNQLRLLNWSGDPCDIQATLLELTARSIASAAQSQTNGPTQLYVCGGGARNSFLMERLQKLLKPMPVESTAALGVDPDWMEAMAFAWLAWRCNTRQPGNLPAVTGALGERILGAIYPA
ncbi:MAG TPA: anhydro-N-acetylmuramic acid kinase [Pseudomonas xinjiangensis]|uniref:Anhydro-N-acetylmuramic acid kinase n=2 Tax=root TaxID=1 RepID=A0A7V1BRN9_9GAMM|nr:anhydro-N-acetylmuramic acid kinase [Halopseudomonas xinjiangensis]HEC48849.1 anhydro-N-acetylmuramic acid kinase [Halopseudomonas xinjiangensis]